MGRVVIVSVGTIEDPSHGHDHLGLSVFDVPGVSELDTDAREAMIREIVDKINSIKDYTAVKQSTPLQAVDVPEGSVDVILVSRTEDIDLTVTDLTTWHRGTIGGFLDTIMTAVSEFIIGGTKTFSDASPVPDPLDPSVHLEIVALDSPDLEDPFVVTGQGNDMTIVQTIQDVVSDVLDRIPRTTGVVDNGTEATSTTESQSVRITITKSDDISVVIDLAVIAFQAYDDSVQPVIDSNDLTASVDNGIESTSPTDSRTSSITIKTNENVIGEDA